MKAKKVKNFLMSLFSMLLIVAITIIIVSCQGKSEEVIGDAELESSNSSIDDEAKYEESLSGDDVALFDIHQYSQNDVSSTINLDDYCVSILYNNNPNKTINRTISIYGNVPVNNGAEVVTSAFSALYSDIKLYSDGECVFSSKKYSVSSTDIDAGVQILFELEIDNDNVEERIYHIDEVELETKAGNVTSLSTDTFWITVYSEAENGVAIMDSPYANTVDLNLDEFIIVDYTFYTINTDSKNEFDVTLYIPDELTEYLDISIFSTAKNEDLTKVVYDELKGKISTEQASILCAYDITTSITRNTEKHFVAQLSFNIDITGEDELIGAFCPFSVI